MGESILYFTSLCGGTVCQISDGLNLVVMWLVEALKLVTSALTLIAAPLKL
jgi:hypothetical protein